MTTPLLRTKLHIPLVRPEVVPRPRLIEQLNAGLKGKLTLISAPAGFGKTTLLSEWVGSCGRPVAWVSLDKGDNDPTRFWAYVVAAMQTVRAHVGEAAFAALQSPQPPAIEALLTGLINRMAEISDPIVLVLDDFHVITAPQINDAFLFLLDNLPPHVHLLLSSRADPPWPLARMRARRDITELRHDDLRFTPSEATVFLNDVMGLRLSAGEIAALEARTEGWIAGLQMAALSMQGREDTTAFVKAFSGSHRFVLDYLVEEVLDSQSGDVQSFLLKTSILERMNASLCDAVTDRDDGQALLARLEQANLFLVPLDDERCWYRYHHLFADLLRSRLQQAQPDQVPAYHLRASEWYEGAGFAEESVTHALAGDDMERAARLVERYGMQMIVRSKLTTLSWWLEALPDALVRARPWLCVYHAWARYWTGRRERGEECLQSAERALESLPSSLEAERRLIAGHIATIRAYYALTNEETPRALRMAQRALDLLPEGAYMHSLAALALGGAYWGKGDVVAAQRAFARASATAQQSGSPLLAVSAACYMGMQQAKQGRLHEALETYREALELAMGPDGREPPVAGFPLVKLGDLAREWNELETAGRDLIRGVELCVEWGQADAVVDGYVALARLRLAQGDSREAAQILQRAERLARRTKADPWITCWLDDCRIRLWLSAGDLAAAVHWAEMSGLKADGELGYQHDLNHINLARVRVAQGVREPSAPYLDEALGLLARLLEAAERANWINEVIKILILQALALRARGEGEGALDALARALTLAEPGAYVRVFIDEGAPMGELLRQAAALGAAVDYGSRLLAALEGETKDERRSMKLAPPFSALRPSPLIEPLSNRELEVLRLWAAHLTRTDIADELFISVNTVRSHIKNIYSKLGVHSRKDAIQQAKKQGLL